MNALVPRAAIAATLVLLLASGTFADAGSPPGSNPRTCASESAVPDDALWQAYRTCAALADRSRLSGDARADFIVGCAVQRTHDQLRITDSSAGVHPRESW